MNVPNLVVYSCLVLIVNFTKSHALIANTPGDSFSDCRRTSPCRTGFDIVIEKKGNVRESPLRIRLIIPSFSFKYFNNFFV